MHLPGRIEVKTAVFPDGDIDMPEEINALFSRHYYFPEYHAAYTGLRKAGTKMLLTREMAGKEFSFPGGYTLRCLYPLTGSVPPSVQAVHWLLKNGLLAKEEERERYVRMLKDNNNADSSVWVLEKGERTITLFGGDCTLGHMEKAIRDLKGHPEALKLQHHGFNSKLKTYYNADHVKRIGPGKLIVVSNDREHYPKMKGDILAVREATGLKPWFTFDGDCTYRF